MRQRRFLISILLIALGWNLGLAASFYAVHLPIVISAPPASTCDASAPILDQDTGSLSAGLDSVGRFIIAYQDREHGSRAHVAQHIGAGLVEVAAPPPPGLASVPAFSPDGAKQGSLALVMGAPGQKSRLYYTQRKPLDTTGPYALWCMEF